jgi:hypothetical protein
MPHDLVLNTAQMRDAIHVQKFRHRSTALNADEIITASAAREIAVQKALQKTAGPASKSAAPQTQRVGQPQRLAALQENSRASTSRARR